MPIQLDQERPAGAPVLRRRSIGESFVGGLIKFEQRDLRKDGQPVLKDNGRPRQEMVVTLLTLQSTMGAAMGDVENVPARGEVVRLILKGGGFSQWIDAKSAFGSAHSRALQVGDLVTIDTTHVTRYQSTGTNQALGDIVTNDELAQYYNTSTAYRDRKESLGFRGNLGIQPAPPEAAAFVVECETAYHEATAIPLEDDVQQAPAPAPDWVTPQQPPAAVPQQQAPAPAAPPAPAPAAPPAADPANPLAGLFGS